MDPATESSEPRRPWHRLHASTWVVGGLVVAVLALLNWPGDDRRRFASKPYFVVTVGSSDLSDVREHGWPYRFLERRVDSAVPLTFQRRLSQWGLGDNVSQFDAQALALNIVIAGFILVAILFLFECWRRQHAALWHLHVRDVLALLLFAGLLLGRWRNIEAQHRTELEVLEKTPASLFVFSHRTWLPTWIREYVGFREEFTAFDYLASAETIYRHPNVNLEVSPRDLEQLARLSRLEELQLGYLKVDDDDLRKISHMNSLQSISLFNTQVTERGYKYLKGMLPHTKIYWVEDDWQTAEIEPIEIELIDP